MNILKYITEILKAETEVSVNGFGTFRKNRIAGRFDHESGTFLPPTTTLSFDHEDTHSDKLENYISEKEAIDLDVAKTAIEEFSTSTLNKLQSGETISLGDFGKLSYENNAVHFSPGSIEELDDDFFGFPTYQEDNKELSSNEEPTTSVTENNTEVEDLSSKESQTIDNISAVEDIETVTPDSEEKTAETDITKAEETNIPVSEPATTAYSADSTDSQNEFYEEEYEQPKNNFVKWLIIVFILAVIAVLLFMAKPDLWEKITGNNKLDTISVYQPITVDTNTIDTINNAIVIGDSLSNEVVKKDSITFEVIVSAEKNQDRIDKIVTNYEKLGYKVKILPGKIYTKISVGSYSTSKEALDSLDSARKKLKNPEAYVYPHHN